MVGLKRNKREKGKKGEVEAGKGRQKRTGGKGHKGMGEGKGYARRGEKGDRKGGM
jgi:hypothetical protein